MREGRAPHTALRKGNTASYMLQPSSQGASIENSRLLAHVAQLLRSGHLIIVSIACSTFCNILMGLEVT